jgi:hypothetical protein
VEPLAEVPCEGFDDVEPLAAVLCERFGVVEPLAAVLCERFGVVEPLAAVRCERFGVVEPLAAVRCERFGVVEPLAAVRCERFGVVEPLAAVRCERFGVVGPLAEPLQAPQRDLELPREPLGIHRERPRPRSAVDLLRVVRLALDVGAAVVDPPAFAIQDGDLEAAASARRVRLERRARAAAHGLALRAAPDARPVDLGGLRHADRAARDRQSGEATAEEKAEDVHRGLLGGQS